MRGATSAAGPVLLSVPSATTHHTNSLDSCSMKKQTTGQAVLPSKLNVLELMQQVQSPQSLASDFLGGPARLLRHVVTRGRAPSRCSQCPGQGFDQDRPATEHNMELTDLDGLAPRCQSHTTAAAVTGKQGPGRLGAAYHCQALGLVSSKPCQLPWPALPAKCQGAATRSSPR